MEPQQVMMESFKSYVCIWQADTLDPRQRDTYRAEAAQKLSAAGVELQKFPTEDVAAAGECLVQSEPPKSSCLQGHPLAAVFPG
jgi:hypothetical protein